MKPTALIVFALTAIGFASPATADPKLEDVAVVRYAGDQTILLYPQPAHPLLLDLGRLKGQVFTFGTRDGAVGKAVIAALETDEDGWTSATLDGLAEPTPMAGLAGSREWIKPLASPPDAPLIRAIIAAQVQSLGERGTLESATAWRAPDSDLLFLEVRTIIAGTKRADAAGNAISGLYWFRWTGHGWLLLRTDTLFNSDDLEYGDVRIIALAANPEKGFDLVLEWDRYEWVILEWIAVVADDAMHRKVHLCVGYC
jgi:hypothetical protein